MTIDDLHSDLIRQSVCACAKLFAEKAHVKNKNIDGFYAKTTQEDSARFV